MKWAFINANGKQCKGLICKIEGCNKKYYSKNLCIKHWTAYRAGRPMIYPKCKECNRICISHWKEGLCGYHYGLWYSRYLNSFNPRYQKDGGVKWGYKDYKKIKFLRKDYCEKCFSKENLDLHHKDKNTRNSNPVNMITLCRKCHLKYHPHTGKSKYQRLYGMTLTEISKKYGKSPALYVEFHQNNTLADFLQRNK